MKILFEPSVYLRDLAEYPQERGLHQSLVVVGDTLGEKGVERNGRSSYFRQVKRFAL